VSIFKLMWEMLPELNWEKLSELVPEVPSCQNTSKGEVHILSLFHPSVPITAVHYSVRLLLLISCDVNLLSSSEYVIL
jgi:hypothetical protein